MSPSRRYTPEQVAFLVESLTNPAFAVREGRVVVANDAFAEVTGLSPSTMVGMAFSELAVPEERRQLVERYQRHLRSGDMARKPTSHRVRGRDGVVRELLVHLTSLEGADGPPFLLCNLLELDERQQEVDLAEQLVEVSAALVSARTEAQVRLAAREGLARAGLDARFVTPGPATPGGPETGSGVEAGEAAERAREALAGGRLLFGGGGLLPTCAWLPLPGTGEVLLLTGGPLPPPSASVLSLFARVLAEALTGARLLGEAERRSAQLQAVAEVARLAAEPTPLPLEGLLARVVDVAEAEGARLMAAEDGAVLAQARRGTAAGLRPASSPPASALPPQNPPMQGQQQEQQQGLKVPLRLGGVVGAYLEVFREGGAPFGAEAQRLVQTLADLLRCVLEQRRLRQEAGRQLNETQLLLELARTTAGTLDMASILDVACDFLVKLLDVSDCFIFLYEEEEGVLQGAAASATHRGFVRSLRIELDAPGLTARVARERQPRVVEDVSRAGPGELREELVARLGGKALLALPLLSRDELIGVVLVDDTRGPRRFAPELLHLADATVGQIALAIANARLYESLWRSYAELAATRAEMVKRERLAALGELSAIVAHEVRNPLGVIFNAVSSLRRLVRPSGDAGMLLDILAEESDRLNRIVSDLLDFSRPRELELQPEEVGGLIQDAVEAARAQPGAAGEAVVFRTQVTPGLPAVPVDRRLIRQALVNVMVNSLQAMPRGGTVRVSAGREQREGRAHLRIDVVDEGPGIPPELLARVFEPFFTTKAKGTGLGLAVVKRIVEEHRGEVEVDSRMGVGTTFTFHLPLSGPGMAVGGRDE